IIKGSNSTPALKFVISKVNLLLPSIGANPINATVKPINPEVIPFITFPADKTEINPKARKIKEVYSNGVNLTAKFAIIGYAVTIILKNTIYQINIATIIIHITLLV